MKQIPLFKVLMTEQAKANVAEVLSSGYVSQGPRVDEFEKALTKTLEVPDHRELVTVNSGTSALALALHLADVDYDSEVVISPMTCAASVIHILHRNAVPVWADVNRTTGLIDPVDVKRKITSKTKAIMGIDWAGISCEYSKIRDMIPPDVAIIEDAAHAFMARNSIDESITKNEADFICYSFQAIKHLSSSDGGALIVPKAQADRAKKLRWFGLDRTQGESFRCSQDITEAGYKYHLNDVCAAIGLGNLEAAVKAVDKNRDNADFYHTALKPHLGARLLAIPPRSDQPSWWIYTILVDDREAFQEHMTARGIATSQVHRRNDEHSAFRKVALDQALPNLDYFAKHQVAIPVGWWLSEDDTDYISKAVIDYVSSSQENE